MKSFLSAPGSSYPFPPSFQNPFGGPRGYPVLRSGDSDSSNSDAPPYIPYEFRKGLTDAPSFDPSEMFDLSPPTPGSHPFFGSPRKKDSPPSSLLVQPPPSSSSSRPSVRSIFGGPPPRGIPPSYSPGSQSRRMPPDFGRFIARMGSSDSGSEAPPSVDDLVDSFPYRDHPSGMPDDVMALREMLEAHRNSSRGGRRSFESSRLSEHARRLLRLRLV